MILSPHKWLFVCSANLCRSPTAEYVARKQGMIARSAGTGGRDHNYYVVTPLSDEIIAWADVIVAMKEGHKIAVRAFPAGRKKKIYVWNMPDVWGGKPFEPGCIEMCERKLAESVMDFRRGQPDVAREDATAVE